MVRFTAPGEVTLLSYLGFAFHWGLDSHAAMQNPSKLFIVLVLFACGLLVVDPVTAAEALPPAPPGEGETETEKSYETKKNGQQRARAAGPVTADGTQLTEPEQDTLRHAERIIITGSNLSEAPPFVPETIFNREAI